jgi:hypothetical protein
MIFSRARHSNNNLDIRIDDQSILQVDSTKFLGVTVDCKLTWTAHINNIRLKASRPAGFLTN